MGITSGVGALPGFGVNQYEQQLKLQENSAGGETAPNNSGASAQTTHNEPPVNQQGNGGGGSTQSAADPYTAANGDYLRQMLNNKGIEAKAGKPVSRKELEASGNLSKVFIDNLTGRAGKSRADKEVSLEDEAEFNKTIEIYMKFRHCTAGQAIEEYETAKSYTLVELETVANSYKEVAGKVKLKDGMTGTEALAALATAHVSGEIRSAMENFIRTSGKGLGLALGAKLEGQNFDDFCFRLSALTIISRLPKDEQEQKFVGTAITKPFKADKLGVDEIIAFLRGRKVGEAGEATAPAEFEPTKWPEKADEYLSRADNEAMKAACKGEVITFIKRYLKAEKENIVKATDRISGIKVGEKKDKDAVNVNGKDYQSVVSALSVKFKISAGELYTP